MSVIYFGQLVTHIKLTHKEKEVNTEKDLQETRRKLYRTMTLDGIGDISSGLIFLAFGGMIYFDASFFLFILILIAPLTLVLRKKIVDPRLGYYDIAPLSGKRDVGPGWMYSVLAILAFGIAAGLLLTPGTNLPAVIGNAALILSGLLVALAIGIAGFYTGISRLYLYAATVFVLFIHGALTEYSSNEGMDLVREAIGAHILVFGSVPILVGLVVLTKFLNLYRIDKDLENGST